MRLLYLGFDSIYILFEEEVILDIVVNLKCKDVFRLVIVNIGVIRFDIFKGVFMWDLIYIILFFFSVFNYIFDVFYYVVKKVIKFFNNVGKIMVDVYMDNEFMVIFE